MFLSNDQYRRLPPRSQPEIRKKWINAIAQHQQFNVQIEYFYICQKHFSAKNFRPNTVKLTLDKNAVPDIFVPHEIEIIEWTEQSDELIQDPGHNEDKCAKLEYELRELQVKYDIDKQLWANKMETSNNKCQESKNETSQLKADLNKERKKNLALSKILDIYQNCGNKSPAVRFFHDFMWGPMMSKE